MTVKALNVFDLTLGEDLAALTSPVHEGLEALAQVPTVADLVAETDAIWQDERTAAMDAMLAASRNLSLPFLAGIIPACRCGRGCR